MSAQHPTAARGIARAIRQLTVGYVSAALSLNGDWLEQAGFPVGTQVRVSVSPGKLVIENLELAAPGTGLPSGQSCAGGEPGSPQG
ncbi:SymE family type I addiction module toxin [Klebsiella pneumoniae]|uniref:SymE family type I addiction module toxin n=1 Tax=Klebsiella pneumoniae TaxID=573 RepID=UPI000B3D7F85|nr:SymE family type I addiction module toxin [Klebsiella pneumoniae]